MSDIKPGLFSSTSAFDGQSKDQLSLMPESVEAVENRVKQITAAMEMDIESMYRNLDEALLYINDPAASRLVEDVRDELYRNLR